MSTYNIQLAEKITFLSFVEYAKTYCNWKTVAVSTLDMDEDDNVLTGKELKDVDRLSDFLRAETGSYHSLMFTRDLLYVVSRYNPMSEGQAKRIVLNSL